MSKKDKFKAIKTEGNKQERSRQNAAAKENVYLPRLQEVNHSYSQ